MIDNQLENLDRRLAGGDAVGRRVAAETLGALGPHAAPASATVVRQSITDPEPLVRYALLEALERIGWECADHVPVFGSLLDDPDQIVQARAAWALGRVGPAAAPTVPALAAVAADEGRLVDPRWSAVVALGRLGRGPASGAAVPTLLGLLSDPDADMREASARSLGAIGEDRAVASALIAATRDRDQLVREGAAVGLGAIGPAAAEAADGLEQLCSDDWPAVRAAAADAADAIFLVTGTPPARLRPGVDGRSSQAAAAALPMLRAGLGSSSERTRGISTFEIGKLGPDAAEAVPLLAGLLAADSNLDVRWSAAWALGRMRVAGVVPALARAVVHDRDPDVRAEAASALGRGGPGQGDDRAQVVVDVLRGALSDRDSLVREEAAVALGRLAGDAAAALPELAGCTSDRHPLVRARAEEALATVRAGSGSGGRRDNA